MMHVYKYFSTTLFILRINVKKKTFAIYLKFIVNFVMTKTYLSKALLRIRKFVLHRKQEILLALRLKESAAS